MTDGETAYRLLNAGDSGQAIAHLERSASAGEPASLLELGIWYLEGRHVRRDLARSRECFRQAGELGDVTAERVFICFLANGVGGETDWPGARKRLQELAARDGDAVRQCRLLDRMVLTEDGYPVRKPVPNKLSSSPEVVVFEGFFSGEECEYLLDVATPLLRQSVIVDPLTGQLRSDPVRTSDGAVFPWAAENMLISALNRRIAAASGTDRACGEPLQVLRYRPGQEYRPHFDSLPTTDNQRILTMLVYLNEGFEGGETFFTRSGLKFAGRLGDALQFRNALKDGAADPNAEHAGLPVTSGEKFVASRWIRERPIVAG